MSDSPRKNPLEGVCSTPFASEGAKAASNYRGARREQQHALDSFLSGALPPDQFHKALLKHKAKKRAYSTVLRTLPLPPISQGPSSRPSSDPL
jgi:hypothetical protein